MGQLQLTLLHKEEEVRRLQERLGVVNVPEGFERNQGNVELSCPTSTGLLVTPVWIQRRGSGEVEMRAGREGEEPTYVDELFLKPDYSREPTQAMPGWFFDLLHGADAGFHDLAQAARTLPNWAAYAEVVRYREEETRIRHLQHDLDLISTKLEAARARLAGCRHRMEAWDLPSQLRNLEGRSNYRDNPRPPQYARRGRGLPTRLSGRGMRPPAAGASG